MTIIFFPALPHTTSQDSQVFLLHSEFRIKSTFFTPFNPISSCKSNSSLGRSSSGFGIPAPQFSDLAPQLFSYSVLPLLVLEQLYFSSYINKFLTKFMHLPQLGLCVIITDLIILCITFELLHSEMQHPVSKSMNHSQ